MRSQAQRYTTKADKQTLNELTRDVRNKSEKRRKTSKLSVRQPNTPFRFVWKFSKRRRQVCRPDWVSLRYLLGTRRFQERGTRLLGEARVQRKQLPPWELRSPVEMVDWAEKSVVSWLWAEEQPYLNNLQLTLIWTQRIQEDLSTRTSFRNGKSIKVLIWLESGRLDPAPTMWPSIGTVLQPKTHLVLLSVRPPISAASREFIRFSWCSSLDLPSMTTSSRFGCVCIRLCRRTKTVISRWTAATAFVTKRKSYELQKTSVYFERCERHVLAMGWDLMIRKLQINFQKKCSQLLDLAAFAYLGRQTQPWTYDYFLSANSLSPSVAWDRRQRKKSVPIRGTWKLELCPWKQRFAVCDGAI